MRAYSSRHGGQYVAVKTTQTGFPRSAARSIVPPPTWGALSGGDARSTSGKGEVVWLAPAVGADPLASVCGDPDAPAGTALAPTAGDAAGDADGSAGDGDGETRTAGTGVRTTMAAPSPTAAPIPTASPMRTAISVRIADEGTA
jgi:hypothetical protein